MAFGLYLWGIRKDLPYVPDVDEPVFVLPAIRIAASGNLDPGWFGNPGSTIIYPLAVLFHCWHALVHHGMLLHPDHRLLATFALNPGEFYLLGRFLTISYAVATTPTVYAVGRDAFGERVGLMGACLSALYPIAVVHAQQVRTDSAAMFFGMLSLWLCLRLLDRPAIGNNVVAGLAIGLSIATRYFMVMLIPVLIVVNLVDLPTIRCRSLQLHRQESALLGACAGIMGALVGFALTTPYFFLSFGIALESLKNEARGNHLGADGLSPFGNFIWYLTEAIPRSITWPQVLLLAIGVLIAVRSRQPGQILLVGFVLTFLVGTSLHPLHWQRWIIQVLPLFALFVANALEAVILWISSRVISSRTLGIPIGLLALTLVAAWPGYQLVLLDITEASPSTRILAREWLLLNLPAGSWIVSEWYTAPLDGTGFVLSEHNTLAVKHGPDDYYRDGYRYVVASSYMYDRFLREPGRYPAEVNFYQTLFARYRLLKQFDPSITRGGPIIRIYELQNQQE